MSDAPNLDLKADKAPPIPNPLREGLAEERIPEPATMVIFGASGDLTRRKLVPALYSLARERLLPARFAVVGYARKPPVDPEHWETFARQVFYQEGDYDNLDAYKALKKRLEEIEASLGLPGNRVFY